MSFKPKTGMLIVNKIDYKDKDYELYLIVSIYQNDITYYYSGNVDYNGRKHFHHINLDTFSKFCTRFSVTVYEI